MFQSRLTQSANAVTNHFTKVLTPFNPIVGDPMRYATQGGKRLRAFLVMESARLHDISDAQSVWPATAIEAMHSYSLVHDDMPCMDDDDLRRGQPTVHVKWDEATAVLAGDALQSLAFELLARVETSPDVNVRSELVLRMARAAGAAGMVLGQAQDIAAETAQTPLTLDEITTLQAGKTGALIEWSATCGAVLAQADPAPLQTYAQALGLAFQIADDILDIEGDEANTGKRLNKDAEAGKATFVSLLGMDAAKSRANQLVMQACDALSSYGNAAQSLREASKFVISRTS